MEVEVFKMIYKMEKDKYNLRILGEVFKNNNKNKAKIIINNKKYPLNDVLSIENIRSKKILMILSKNIYNKSCMFKNCELLESVSKPISHSFLDDSWQELNNNEIITENKITGKGFTSKENSFLSKNMEINSNEFTYISEKEEENSEISIKYLNNTLKLERDNYTILSEMFSNCKSLSSIPDISNWDTRFIINISYMFSNCEQLSSLPYISEWNTSNVFNMSYMFSNCKSLISLPDISKWDTANVTNIKNMFSNCEKLSSLSDISKWNTNNVTDMSYMFSNCKSLLYLPNISKWNTNSVTKINHLFYNCENLLSISNISKWNIKMYLI